ncbi:hypothetical protein PMAYCL1PPCAC_20835, partial [Pristionchus mayeri]
MDIMGDEMAYKDEPLQEEKIAHRLKCVVCERLCNRTKMHRFTTCQDKRAVWVNAVRSTPESRSSLLELLSLIKKRFLCCIHFSPSDYFHSGKGFRLRSDAVPYFVGETTSLSKIDTPNEIKEEPVEEKEEVIDGFSDIKQEDSKTDVFCPSTGTSRPVYESARTTTSDVPSKTKIVRRKCIVCNRSCNREEMHSFTLKKDKRALWVNAIRSSPEGRASLLELLSLLKHPVLCSSHFSPSNYYHNGKGVTLRSDAVPSFVVS